MCKKGCIWNSAKCACESGKYLGRIIEDLVIWDIIIETKKNVLSKTFPTKSIDEKKVVCKMKKNYILHAILLIVMILLKAASIYFCLIIYQTKPKHLLAFFDFSNREIDIKNMP